MAQARYIVRMEDQELFPFLEAWLRYPGFVEYDPAVHGYRAEIAAQMGLPPPAPVAVAAPKPEAAPEKAKPGKAPKVTAVTEPKAQEQAEPNLSDVFRA